MAAQTKKIAQKRIEYLYELAKKWSTQQRTRDAKTAIQHMRKLATKYLLSIRTYKRDYCKNCNNVFTATNMHVRIKKKYRAITCHECSWITRIGH